MVLFVLSSTFFTLRVNREPERGHKQPQMRRAGRKPASASSCPPKTKVGHLEPFCNSPVMRTCASMTLAEAVTSITALRGRSLRSCWAISWARDLFSLAVSIGAIVGAFWLRMLLLLIGWLGSLPNQRHGQYSKEQSGWQASAHQSAHITPCGSGTGHAAAAEIVPVLELCVNGNK